MTMFGDNTYVEFADEVGTAFDSTLFKVLRCNGATGRGLAQVSQQTGELIGAEVDCDIDELIAARPETLAEYPLLAG
ncbi:Uncharacterised protein [Mycobacteroides abscessus subsp. abscessus]|uniref:hypothetical protein n=1 Tax=Mycobacteroides abscessus TaxID=36809 RepID=UPI00092B4436|nr:hypothetical protein [Mycobacteroides abscessus]SIH39083.1 Uncharacterised protein [Mycobacteroides abscessus subsp. abscessus]